MPLLEDTRRLLDPSGSSKLKAGVRMARWRVNLLGLGTAAILVA
jgi:hypothetical protein